MRPCTTPECRRLHKLLSDFIDGSLHWRTTRSLEAHITSCPPCRLHLRTIEQTILLYRSQPAVEVPQPLRSHLRELLRERHERSPRGAGGRRRAK